MDPYSKRIKLWLAKKYLDWAEQLPKFQGGPIHRLQLIRSYQRARSQQSFDISRPPAGMRVAYKQLVLVELFELEDIEGLTKGLQQLFGRGRNIQELGQQIESTAKSLYAGGWQRIGYVYRSRPGIPVFHTRQDDQLPPCTEYASVWIQTITPSLTSIAFTFNLTEEASTGLHRLQQTYYLPDTEFKGLLPFGKYRSSHSENNIDTVLQRAVLEHTRMIRQACETWVYRYFRGCFQRSSNDPGHQLAAIEVMAFHQEGADAAAAEPSNSDAWKSLTGGWANSLGFDRRNPTFSDNDYVYSWPTLGHDKQSIPSRLSISDKCEGHITEFVLLSLFSPVALVGYLSSLRNTIESRRMSSFKSTRNNKLQLNSAHLVDSLTLQKAVVRLDRLGLEMKDSSDLIMHSMESISAFKSSDTFYGGKSLDAVMKNDIESRLDSLKIHANLAQQNISGFISIQNVSVMFLLQKRMFWLSFVAAILALVSAVTGYDKLLELWHLWFS